MHGFSSAARGLGWTLLAIYGGDAFAKDIGTFPSENGVYLAVVRTLEGEPDIESRRVTALSVTLSTTAAAAQATNPLVGPPAPPFQATGLRFGAWMPAHKHEMPLKPEITQSAPEEFIVRGVKLPMVGAWELTIDAILGSEPVRFRIPVVL